MEMGSGRCKPLAVFMAFGTKGDVHPIVAIAAAFACNEMQYRVVFITHSAHENLQPQIAESNIDYIPISSPPVLSTHKDEDYEGLFSQQKMTMTREHRQECFSVIERVFGHDATLEGDFIIVNFFALEGWSLAELFRVRCVVAAPYVVPYSAPSSFERHFRREHPLLYDYLRDAPIGYVCWKDVIHWMWPLFTEAWGLYRSNDLNLSPCPFTDPVTGLPMWHDRSPSPLLLYGFSEEVVECPTYWPSNVRVCGFWFLPFEKQFSCSAHADLQSFLETSPIFIGLSSVGSMGFLGDPQVFLEVLRTVLESTSHRFILFTSGYEPLDLKICLLAAEGSSSLNQKNQLCNEGITLFSGRLFCFSGSVPYHWVFPRCVAAIHHGGSGSTAAALRAGIPQMICPFMLDQFYWAERMFWLGVAPSPLKRTQLLPDKDDSLSIREAANELSTAVSCALSPLVKACAAELAVKICSEDGVAKAVKILKEEMNCPNHTKC